MKGYEQPKSIEWGMCFLCGKPCERYVHYECALAFDEEKKKRIQDAKEKVENQNECKEVNKNGN